MGIQRLERIPFTQEFASLSPEAFVEEYLVRRLNLKHLVVGEDFHFGYQRKGTVNTLKELGDRFGFTVSAVSKLKMDGSPVSSTRIRACYTEGRIKEAERLLGHPVMIQGIVRHGQELGRTIGFPTLNLIPDEEKLLPVFGVYASTVETPEGTFRGITNIGNRPTVHEGTDVTVETYLPGFQGDLYDREIKVVLSDYIRSEQRFDTVEHLQEQMKKDIQFLDYT